MAQTENGVGISFKLNDGTMVWARRDTWAELTEDIGHIWGPESLSRLEPHLHRAWGGNKPSAPPVPPPKTPPHATEMPADAAAAVLTDSYETCPKCGALKDKWVPPGTSTKTGKPYKGFFGCPTQGCPGR